MKRIVLISVFVLVTVIFTGCSGNVKQDIKEGTMLESKMAEGVKARQ